MAEINSTSQIQRFNIGVTLSNGTINAFADGDLPASHAEAVAGKLLNLAYAIRAELRADIRCCPDD